MKIRRIVSLFVGVAALVAMLLFVVGCGGGSDSVKNTVDAGTAVTGDKYDVTVDNPEETVIINVEQDDAYSKAAHAFIKVPVKMKATKDVTIKAEDFGMDYEENGYCYKELKDCLPEEVEMNSGDDYFGFLYYEWLPMSRDVDPEYYESRADYPKSVTDAETETEWKFTYDCSTPIEVDGDSIFSVLPGQKIKFVGDYQFGDSFVIDDKASVNAYVDLDTNSKLVENANNGSYKTEVEARVLSVIRYTSGAESNGYDKIVYIDKVKASTVE